MSEPFSEFVEGERVTWSSQAQGYRRTKVGVVAQILPSGALPDRERFPSLYREGIGMPRDHVSYVVKCAAGDNAGKGRAYWPRASQLSRAEPAPDTPAPADRPRMR